MTAGELLEEYIGKCSIIPHDLEDFKSMLLEHGPDWITEPGAVE